MEIPYLERRFLYWDDDEVLQLKITVLSYPAVFLGLSQYKDVILPV